ncbi:hypothetical protein Tco_0320460 [Tanacetum coccineum]
MTVLESCPKHNMVAYLEKTDGNAEFHEIIDFLARSSIHNALTVSPVVSTTFVEQFWMSAKSKIINNVRYITAKVVGKPVSISEASIRSDLLFDDADGIDSLPNQAIFDAIQLMGYEGDLTVLTFNKALHLDAKKKFVMYPRFISVFLDTQLKSVPVPLDHFPVNALTSKDEGEQSERPSEPQLTPSPPHPSEVHVEPQSDPSPRPSPTTHIPDSIPESSGGNHGDQAKEIQHSKAQIKKLKKKAKPVITHHRAWMKSVSLKQGLAGKKSLKKTWMQKDSVSKQRGKSARLKPTVHKDQAFDELEKERKEKEVSTEDAFSTDKEKYGRSATPTTPTPTPTTFRDDETIAQVLLKWSQGQSSFQVKEKGVELKDVENIERPRPTSTRSLLTLKPLPKIDPKDKGKKKIEEDEYDTESEDINETENKFKMLAHDEEIARKMQEDWETEEERKRLAEEKATNAALIQDFDDIKARIEADRLLALRLQKKMRGGSSLWKKEQNSFMIQLQLKESFLQNKELLQ